MTKRIAGPRSDQQPVSISMDDAQPSGKSPQARNVTPLTAIDNQDNDEGPQGNISPSGDPPLDVTYPRTSISNAASPLPEWLLPPVQSANDFCQQLSVSQQMEGPNIRHHPGTEDYPNYDSPSILHRAPLLDLSMVDSWPLSTTLHSGYDLNDFDLGIVFNGASISLESTNHLLDGSPIRPSLPMPTINSNTPKVTETTQWLQGTDPLKRIQQIWSTKGTSQSSLLVRTLWKDIAEHNAANILSDPEAHVNLFPTPSSEHGSESGRESRITSQCRERLLEFYRRTQGNRGEIFASNGLSPPECQSGDLSSDPPTGPDPSEIHFPSVDVLDLSLKFYFRHVHQSLPFVHRPTFNASTTPSLLLLPMILIGYSILDPHGAQSLVSSYRTVHLYMISPNE
jgi:hypothetical protein